MERVDKPPSLRYNIQYSTMVIGCSGEFPDNKLPSARKTAMAKVKQFERVLEVLQNASPKSVSKEDLVTALGKDVEMYRISTYIWEVKNKAGVPVESIKDGRKVVGFRVVDTTTVPAPATETVAEVPEASEVADAATA